jgi:hypothetical protein
MTQKPTFKNRYNNFDYLMYKYIEIKFENVPSVKVNVPKSPFIVKTIQDWNFLLLHGDGIKGFAGIPYYGMRRMDSQMSQLLVTQKDTYPHYICIGHFHDANSLSKIGGRIIMNGSVKGADGFSIGKMFTASEPSQTIFSVHPDHGITWSFNLHID